ncbi:Protein kinase [Sorangium cellulosum So ce56]|uniref:Protein kinase n=1 Tax=Sorangium cellulosum (strain So ce56) TaxID=448385 RepID=A9EMV8_SORC5|nr:serine/threonine-protein kinase [Sorangium cellulosum]CAN90789.1 Protein kinase [Sorangium cellulosum So ce56]
MAREALKAGDVFLDYRITEVIDAGGMGEVYKAVEDYSEDVVAIKCMLPRHLKREDFARRFRQECKFYPKLKHPNIVRMRKAGVSPEHVAYIVMDYLEGRTLRKLLNKAYRLDFLSAMHVMLQVADAMTFVHSKGIWHRDLKPENIMVGTKADAKGHVWLLDFGIAKFADGGMNTDDLPDVGTVRYISPEQVKLLYTSSRKAERVERARPDGRTDIYAFGAIFYEVLTGKHLFLDDSEPATAEETLTGHLVAAPEPVHEIVPDCPEFVWPVVARCIAIDREERYPRFDDVARDLRGLLRETVPAGHVLAQRLARERMEAERQAAFAGVALEDSAPVEDEKGAAGRAGEEETEEARGRSVEGGMERGGAAAERGEKRGRRVVHGETAPLEQFVAPASALPFAPASRVPRGRGVGHTEPLPALKPLESTAKLGGTWAEKMAQRAGAAAMPQAGPPPMPPAEVRAGSYAGPVPMPQSHGGPPSLPQAYAGPPPMPQTHGGPVPMPQAYAGPPPMPQAQGGPASMPQAYAGPPPMPQANAGPVPMPQSHGGRAQMPQAQGGPAPMPQAYGGPPPPMPPSYGGPASHVGAQGYGGPPPLPVMETQHAVPLREARRVAPQPPQEVELPYVTPQLLATEVSRPGTAPPIAARPAVPSAGPVEALRKETPTPTTPAPAALLTQPRRAPRAYVLAPVVALALTLGGVGAVLGLRSARDTAPEPATGEPAATAAAAESATANAAAAPPEASAAAAAPPPEASAAAPTPEATAPTPEATASTAEAAVEAGAVEKTGAAAEVEAPASKEQAEAAKAAAGAAKAEPAKAAPVKAAAETEDDEEFYPMPKRQKPSFLRVIEERKKAAPAKPAAPAKQQGAKPAGPCATAGCRPF